MIVAEDITSRFLNVISLFNRAIPLVAIQLRALDVGGVLTLHATKVLDLTTFPVEEEEAEHEESADRAYWERRGTKETVSLADRLLSMIREVTGDSELALKYNKHYIGLAKHGIANNFIWMRPRKTSMIADFKTPRSDELPARLDDEGFDALPYDTRTKSYRLRLTAKDFTSRPDSLADMIRQASGFGTADQGVAPTQQQST